MKGIVQDLRYPLRQVRNRPGFSEVAILTLARRTRFGVIPIDPITIAPLTSMLELAAAAAASLPAHSALKVDLVVALRYQ